MYAYVSPRCWLGSGGDTHAKWRAPPVFVPGGPTSECDEGVRRSLRDDLQG